jgi:DNA-binding CsgD family transcriptional regulator
MSWREDSQLAHDQLGLREGETRTQRATLEEAEREVDVLLAASEALTAWDSFEYGVERLLRGLAEALGLTAAALWLPQDDALVARASWSADAIDRAAVEGLLRDVRLQRGIGVAGCAWERREPVDRARANVDIPQALRAPDGLRDALGLPVLAGEEVLWVVELYSVAPADFSPRLMHVLSAVGRLLGAFLARRRGEVELSPLTGRELDVLTLAAEGLTGRKIAEQLSISSATVKTHLEHVYRKLGVSDRTAAVAHALRAGFIA